MNSIQEQFEQLRGRTFPHWRKLDPTQNAALRHMFFAGYDSCLETLRYLTLTAPGLAADLMLARVAEIERYNEEIRKDRAKRKPGLTRKK